MTASPITGLLIDFDCLWQQRSETPRYQAFANACGIPSEEVRKRLSSSGYIEACIRGRMRGARALREAERLLGTRLGGAQLAQLWMTGVQANATLLQLTDALPQTLTTAVAGNCPDFATTWIDTHWPVAHRRMGLSIYSCNIGQALPDPVFFLTATRLTETPAASTVFVTDTQASAAAAEFAGLKAVTPDTLPTVAFAERYAG